MWAWNFAASANDHQFTLSSSVRHRTGVNALYPSDFDMHTVCTERVRPTEFSSQPVGQAGSVFLTAVYKHYNDYTTLNEKASKPVRLEDLAHFSTFSEQLLTQISQYFWRDWIEFRVNEASDSDRRSVIDRRLNGGALAWWSKLKPQTQTYNEFVKLFLEYFRDSTLKNMKFRRLLTFKYTSSEYGLDVDLI